MQIRNCGKQRLRFLILICTLILLFFEKPQMASAQPPQAPRGSFYDYYAYLFPLLTTTSGADTASTAVVALSYVTPDSFLKAATGFFINTYRSDKKKCFCTSAHFINNYFSGTPSIGGKVSLESYFKYWGRPAPFNIIYNENLSSYSATLPAELVAYQFSQDNDGTADIALLLVDEDFLPIQNFSTLGYSFENSFTINDRFFAVGHPHKLAQRIIDSVKYAFHDMFRDNYYMLSLDSRQNTSTGASGGPILKKTSSGAYVTGALKGLRTYSQIPDAVVALTDPGKKLLYSGSIEVSSMSVIMDEIKANCWKSRTEQDLLASGDYKKSIKEDNSVLFSDHYGADKAIAGTSGIQSQRNAAYTTSNPGISLVTGKSIAITGIVDPGVEANLATIYVVSPEVNLNDAFSYTSATGKELDVNSMVLEPATTQAAQRRTGTIANESLVPGVKENGVVVVYPNPTSGFVNIVGLPKSEMPYNVQVYNAAGLLVRNESHMEEACRINLSDLPEGSYLVFVTQQGKELLREKLIKHGMN
ncbi:T9SS type A sorting domain-containing protein [Taibaiella soli]|nr:T9SS type A sorting domain-containing protein [Taibaiella soli]